MKKHQESRLEKIGRNAINLLLTQDIGLYRLPDYFNRSKCISNIKEWFYLLLI